MSLAIRSLVSTRVLDRAEAYWRADVHDATNDRLSDLTGHGHHAQLGSANGADTNDPTILVRKGEQYLYLTGVSGNYCSMPDLAAYTPASTLEFEALISLDDWTRAADEQAIVTKWGASSDEWICRVSKLGELKMLCDGGGSTISTEVAGGTDGELLWVRGHWDLDDEGGNDVANFYTSTETSLINPDDVTWTQLGATVTTASGGRTVGGGADEAEIGSHTDGTGDMAAGKFKRVRVKIDGTTQIDVDFTQNPTPTASTFTESSAQGATVTINRSATGLKSSVVHRTLALLGTDNYFEVANHPDLDFAVGDSFTVVWAGRLYDTSPDESHGLMSNSGSLGGQGWNLYQATNTFTIWRLDDTNVDIQSAFNGFTNGEAIVVTGRRDVSADQISISHAGVVGDTDDDTTTATIANVNAAFIGSTAVPANFYDGEFFAAAVFREALSDDEVREVGIELGFVPA